MPFNAYNFTGALRDLYNAPIIDIIHNENSATFFCVDRLQRRITGDIPAAALTIEMLQEAVNVSMHNMINQFEQDLYNDQKYILEQSLLTMPQYPTEDPIMFDQEWV